MSPRGEGTWRYWVLGDELSILKPLLLCVKYTHKHTPFIHPTPTRTGAAVDTRAESTQSLDDSLLARGHILRVVWALEAGEQRGGSAGAAGGAAVDARSEAAMSFGL
jgi:hypothetical protein